MRLHTNFQTLLLPLTMAAHTGESGKYVAGSCGRMESTGRPVKLWFDPKQIATETISPVLIQEISPEHHIKNII